jgi:hypothetical protein
MRELYLRYLWQDKAKKAECGATPKHQDASQYTPGSEKNASANSNPTPDAQNRVANLAQNGAERKLYGKQIFPTLALQLILLSCLF